MVPPFCLNENDEWMLWSFASGALSLGGTETCALQFTQTQVSPSVGIAGSPRDVLVSSS